VSERATVIQSRRRRTMSTVLTEADDALRKGLSPAAEVWPTGFDVLDRALSGGLRSGELVVVAGAQGQGKTTFVVQALRTAALSGRQAIMFSYEHESGTLLERLLALEAAELAESPGLAPGVHGIRRVLEEQQGTPSSMRTAMSHLPYGPGALLALEQYADRLSIHESNAGTDLGAIEAIIAEMTAENGEPPIVAIDYVQKVPVPVPGGEEEQVAIIAEALKDLALDVGCPIIAISAAQTDSLASGHRMRAHDLRGASSLAYEADVIIVLSSKEEIVSREHLVYDLSRMQQYRGWSVFSIEKNRHGADNVDLEFPKDFANGRYVPFGGIVQERLIEERVITR